MNDPPLRHASKPDSYYRNDKSSYKSLTELLTRMRLERHIPFDCLEDSTRPIIIARPYEHAGLFMTEQADQFLKGYYRNLQQSQPNHVEIVYEKDTGRSFVEPVALEFCIPLTVGRGFASLSPRVAMARRFSKSGKEKLIVISMSDLDPDGDEITHSFARSMRDDFSINVECIRCGLFGGWWRFPWHRSVLMSFWRDVYISRQIQVVMCTSIDYVSVFCSLTSDHALVYVLLV